MIQWRKFYDKKKWHRERFGARAWCGQLLLGASYFRKDSTPSYETLCKKCVRALDKAHGMDSSRTQ